MFNQIGDTRISIGVYPLSEKDIAKLKDKCIKAVLNLQTDAEMTAKGVNWRKIKEFYSRYNIKVFRCPVSDETQYSLQSGLFIAAQYLNDLMNS